MSETLKKRQYGEYEWVSIADEKNDPLENRKVVWKSRSEVVKRYAPSTATVATTSKRMRDRWRALGVECKKRGYDGLSWEDYKELWRAAGDVQILGDVMLPAHKIQKKFYSKEFRSMLVRIDERRHIGFKPGNVAVVLVEGGWRNHRKLELPEYLEVLSFLDETGNVVAVGRGHELNEVIVDRLLNYNLVSKGTPSVKQQGKSGDE